MCYALPFFPCFPLLKMSCPVILIAAHKGGCGKTTLTLNLASQLARLGLEVATLDIDPQESLYDWHQDANRVDFDCVACGRKRGEKLPDWEKRFYKMAVETAGDTKADILLIDTPPSADEILQIAAGISDLIIVPLVYERFATRAMPKTRQLFSKIDKPTYVVLNRYPPVHHVKQCADALELIDRLKLPAFATRITKSTAFENAEQANMTVMEHNPSSLSAQQIEALTGEVFACFANPHMRILANASRRK